MHKHAIALKAREGEMASERRLLTIVQISDLHFGDLRGSNDDSDLDAVAESWWQANPLFDGYLGHSGDALRHLNQAFKQLRDDESAMLLVTGDLTAVGGDSQFSLAGRYLQATAALPSGRSIGLQVGNVLVNGAAPGNHDHWPGRRAVAAGSLVMWGRSTKSLSQTFSNLPVAPVNLQRLQLTPKCYLSIGGIDTDAQIHPTYRKDFQSWKPKGKSQK